MDDNTTPERQCPTCGASMPAEARFCGSCGMDTLPVEASAASAAKPAMRAAAATAAATTQATPAQADDTEQAGPAAYPDGKVCSWCGTRNPKEATRCMACDATFPTPEGDEALERAARARIQAMEGEFKQPKRAGWWPFRQH